MLEKSLTLRKTTLPNPFLENSALYSHPVIEIHGENISLDITYIGFVGRKHVPI